MPKIIKGSQDRDFRPITVTHSGPAEEVVSELREEKIQICEHPPSSEPFFGCSCTSPCCWSITGSCICSDCSCKS